MQQPGGAIASASKRRTASRPRNRQEEERMDWHGAHHERDVQAQEAGPVVDQRLGLVAIVVDAERVPQRLPSHGGRRSWVSVPYVAAMVVLAMSLSRRRCQAWSPRRAGPGRPSLSSCTNGAAGVVARAERRRRQCNSGACLAGERGTGSGHIHGVGPEAASCNVHVATGAAPQGTPQPCRMGCHGKEGRDGVHGHRACSPPLRAAAGENTPVAHDDAAARSREAHRRRIWQHSTGLLGKAVFGVPGCAAPCRRHALAHAASQVRCACVKPRSKTSLWRAAWNARACTRAEGLERCYDEHVRGFSITMHTVAGSGKEFSLNRPTTTEANGGQICTHVCSPDAAWQHEKRS